ncbi:MAG TPA: tetratricopeptide repeat protein [Chitinophagales bacterium]|nr:tetratricopeptide repeat protein [Chitinophagales bacterium]
MMKHLYVTALMILLTFPALAQKKAEKSYYEKALSEIESENYEGAIADLNKAIAADSLHDAAYFKRGFVKAMLLDHQGALDDFNRAIKINPDDAQYYSERGVAKMHLKDREGACADWKKASSMGFQPAEELAYEYCE